MHIIFPYDLPHYRASELVVVFQAQVKGVAVECAITVEALEDHFSAASARQEDALQAFSTNRAEIEAIALDLLRTENGAAPLIRSGLLRFKDAQK